jgi:hypothetical protein
MRIYKQKQFLIFDYEDGRTVKYDFATKEAIGLKGKPVKDLKSQLRGYTLDQLFDFFDNQKYAKFLKYIQREESKCCTTLTNVGTILDRVSKYADIEQIYSAGFEDIISLDGRCKFPYKIIDIPKSLIKVAKNNKVKISVNAIKHWKNNPDAHYIGYNLQYISLTDDDVNNIWSSDWYNYRTGCFSYFNMLIDDYGYNAKALFLYIDTLKTFEALEDMHFIMKELYDYANMMKTISTKYDKYPRNFLTTHKIACRNYNRLKKEYPEELFKKRINKNYEYTCGEYRFIYPDCVQDIRDEAVQQNNCVASYIDRVIDGKCHIMFLRKKDNPDKSLVTLEIVHNKIVQARRRFNDPVTLEDQEAIDKWNKKYAEKEKLTV